MPYVFFDVFKEILTIKGSFHILIHTYIHTYIYTHTHTSIVGVRGFESYMSQFELGNTKNYKLSYKTLGNSS